MLSSIRPLFEWLYTGVFDATIEVATKNEYGRTVTTKEKIYENIPCRLSHDSSLSSLNDPLPEASQDITMFTYPDCEVHIPEGARITITQDNVTRDYRLSGIPNNFETHQEIKLIAVENGI